MEAKAAQQALEIILDWGLREAWIHRHYFVGGVEEFNQWSSLLPNCFLAFLGNLLQIEGHKLV